MNETVATIEDVPTDLSITEGRVGMGVEAEAATVRLRVPETEPLSRREPVLTVDVAGEGLQGAVRLDTDDVRVLARVLADITGEEVLA